MLWQELKDYMTKARDLADIVSDGAKETQLHGIGLNY